MFSSCSYGCSKFENWIPWGFSHFPITLFLYQSTVKLFLSLRMDQTRETETKAFFVSSYLFFPWKLYTKILLCGNVYDMLLSILILFKMTFVFHATAHLPCFKRLNCLFLHSQSNYILLKFLSSSIPVLFICTCVDSLHAYRLLFFTNALSFGRKFLYIIRKPRNSSYICEYVNFLWSKTKYSIMILACWARIFILYLLMWF